MGNSSSSSGRGHHDESVDYGSLIPQGVYSGPRDWNQAVVSQAIVARRIAPFYRPLEDYDDAWDDDQILAARKELPESDNPDTVTRIEPAPSSASHTGSVKSKRPGSLKEPAKPEAQVYRGAIECPICFLYYPPNINRSRCCDQAICTECFVQIKRSEPTTTHLSSEVAACPYCVQENFGVVYTPPPWRAGLGADHSWTDMQRSPTDATSRPTHKRRQKSFGADSPEVVLTDHIRPDWEAKLDAVRAAVARRANRRIIMRQVGDRLIPVGVTSGRVHALSPEEAAAAGAEGGGGRRSRRRGQGDGGEQFMGMTGPDLEELMLMEAMRLSLLDHEEQQRKEAEEKKKKKKKDKDKDKDDGPSAESPTTDRSTGAGPSTLETPLTTSSSANLSTNPPSVRTPSPSSRRHTPPDSADSLSPGRKSWSISRSRTPPPPNPVSNVPVSEENQAAWRSRNAGPPPFSTLSAALTSASTAAAVLGASGSDSRPVARTASPEPGAAPSGSASSLTPPPTSAANEAAAQAAPVPTITVGADANTTTHAPEASDDTTTTSNSNSTTYSDAPLPPTPGEPSASIQVPASVKPASSPASPDVSLASTSVTSSTLSGTQNGVSQYGTLPSSPESLLTEPLLGANAGGKADANAVPSSHAEVSR